MVICTLKKREQHNITTNDTNSTNGTNNFLPFGGIYCAKIIIFNGNHEITFNWNQLIIKYKQVAMEGVLYHTL